MASPCAEAAPGDVHLPEADPRPSVSTRQVILSLPPGDPEEGPGGGTS
jgi:hypothetical protein